MGMTYDQFWNSNTKIHKAYREAYEARQRTDEWSRWRQGLYIYDALLCVAPVMRAAFSKSKVEPGKYPEEPWPISEKEVREREVAAEKDTFERLLANMNATSERELKRRAEEAEKEARSDGD
jgi:hypothetical protein